MIFYQNSIVEEIEKQSTAIEVQRSNSCVLTSSSFNPLLPTTMAKPTISLDQTAASPAPSAIQQNLLAVSSSNSVNPPQILNREIPVESSKTVLGKSSEKIEISTDVLNSNSIAPASLASNPLFQSLASPLNNVSQSKNSTSTKNTQFSVSVPETTKSNSPFGGNFSPVFGGFGNVMSTPAVSSIGNKIDNETSSVTTSSISPSSLNQLKSQSKSTADEKPPCTSVPMTLISTSSSVNTNPSLFAITNSSTPSVSVPNSTFTISNSASQNPGATFKFGSKSASAFQQGNNANSNLCTPQTSVYNADVVTSAPTQSSVFDTVAPSTINAQSNIFGAINQPSQTNSSTSSIFGASSQTASTVNSTPIFGVSSQPASTVIPKATQSVPHTSMFGSNSQSTAASTVATFSPHVSTQSSAAVQPSFIGNTGLFQSQPSSQAQVTTFGSSGDLPNNIFGQSQSAAPRVGVVNPLPQVVPQFGSGNAAISQFGSGNAPTSQFGTNNSSSRFTFGGVSNLQPDTFGTQQTSTPAAFGTQQTSTAAAFGAEQNSAPAAAASATSMQSPFGAKPAVSSTVGAISSGTPQFNFNAPSPFGSAANAFNTTSNNAPSSGSGPFNFGANNSQSSQPAFQFGSINSAPTPNQPFLFGGNAARKYLSILL